MYATRSLYELLAEWRRSRFTGMALVHVRGGVPRVVEFGRPNRIELQHEEPLSRTDLSPVTVPIPPPIPTPIPPPTSPGVSGGLTTKSR